MLSLRTVAYGSGRIARAGDPVRHNIDPDELALPNGRRAWSPGQCNCSALFVGLTRKGSLVELFAYLVQT